MKLSIVIVNYRGWKKLRLCLQSLQSLKLGLSGWEVIVVDNQSADNQLQNFVKEFPDFRFIENEGNFGFSNGCNFGASHASGEYLLFLNPDTKITIEQLLKLLKTAGEHPEITVLSCSQFTDGGKDTRPYGVFISPATLTGFLRSIHRLTHKDVARAVLPPDNELFFPDWVSGSVVLISRKKFDQLSGWCEDYWMYYEDADLCKRVWESGGQVALANNVRFIHNHGGASRINIEVKALTKCEVIISRHVFIYKHFRGVKRLAMQSYLVINNLLIGALLLAVLGIILFFIPSLKVYPKLYMKIVRYYAGVLSSGVWISPRSVNFKKTAAGVANSKAA